MQQTLTGAFVILIILLLHHERSNLHHPALTICQLAASAAVAYPRITQPRRFGQRKSAQSSGEEETNRQGY